MNRREPKPKAGIPASPIKLSRAAKRAWNIFAAILDEMGVLTQADGPALAALCETYAELAAARKIIAKEGLTIQRTATSGGTIVLTHPATAIAAEADRRLQAWMAKFGLTPADRSRVEAHVRPEKGGGWGAI